MGRYYLSKKDTVEDGTKLSIFKLKEFGLLGGYRSNTLTWTRSLSVYPYPLSRQKTGEFKMDSPPTVTAVGTQGARRATGVPTATP